MTDPTHFHDFKPCEAAVEAASAALRDVASKVDETRDDLPEDYISEACVTVDKVTCIHGSPELIARVALTAARPHMEAEALNLAAGYRNRPMPSVDEVACVVADVMRWEDFVAPDVIEPSADCYRIATAVLALINGGNS